MGENYGTPIHYSAIERNTPVYDSTGTKVGLVKQVVDNYREQIFDGLVIEDSEGSVRFVDAPEVQRTFERGVTLTIDAAEVTKLPPPENGPGEFGANLSTGRLSKLFGGAWRRKS